MASTYLTRNMTTQGSSIKGTFSCWFKLASDNLTGGLLSHYFSSNYLFDICLYNANIEVADYRSNAGGYLLRKRTTAKYRDLNAWYHLYVAIDRSLGTAVDRCKIYVNGDRVTDFLSNENADYSQQTSGGHSGAVSMNNDYTARVGVRYDTTYFDGSISHMHWVDGSVIDIAQFGSTDSTTGEWKINTSPTVADYGTNGFFILKDGNTITDQSSGGSYDFTVGGGTLTKTEDNPSNVFATLNPLVPDAGSTGLFHGNNQLNVNTANWRSAFSTLGMSSGKFYFESQIQAGGYIHIGARGVEQSDGSLAGNNDWIGVTSQGWSYDKTGEVRNNNSSVASGKATFGNTDIIGCLLDLDNWTINWTKNGTLINSTAYNITQNLTYVFGVSGHSTARILTNFGNGNFSSTTISSAGTNASNNGIFEYDVPSGFTALSTKGLNL